MGRHVADREQRDRGAGHREGVVADGAGQHRDGPASEHPAERGAGVVDDLFV
jgi:hypothetical protein